MTSWFPVTYFLYMLCLMCRFYVSCLLLLLLLLEARPRGSGIRASKSLPLSCSSAPVLYFSLWGRILLKSSRLVLTAWSSCLCFLWIWDYKPIPPGLPLDFCFNFWRICFVSSTVWSFLFHFGSSLLSEAPQKLYVGSLIPSFCNCFHLLYVLFESSPTSVPST